MKNKHIICLLICNLITCSINASNNTEHNYEQNIQVSNNVNQIMATNNNNNSIHNNTEVGIVNNFNATSNNLFTSPSITEIDLNKITVKKFSEVLFNVYKNIFEKNALKYNSQENNPPLVITNDYLRCALISLLHCFQYLDSNNNEFLLQLKTRYNDLLAIQQLFKDRGGYTVFPGDVVLYLKNFTNDTDRSPYMYELMQYEHEIANVMHNNAYVISAPLMDLLVYMIDAYKSLTKIKESINIAFNEKIFRVNSINVKNNNNEKENIKEEDINFYRIFESNTDPAEVLNYLIESFATLNNKDKKNILPIYNLSCENNQYKLVDKYDFKPIKNYNDHDNAIVECKECNIVFRNNYIQNNSESEPEYDLIKDLGNNIEYLDRIVNNNRNTEMKLKAISAVCAYNDNYETFHYVAIVRNSNNTWNMIDSDGINTEKSLFMDFFKDNKKDKEYRCFDKNGIDRVYVLRPVILFYSKSQDNINNTSIKIITNTDCDKQSDKLYNISKKVSGLLNKVPNIKNNNSIESINEQNEKFYEPQLNFDGMLSEDVECVLDIIEKDNTNIINENQELVEYDNNAQVDTNLYNYLFEDNINQFNNINSNYNDIKINQWENTEKDKFSNTNKYNKYKESIDYENQLPLDENSYDSANIYNNNEENNSKEKRKTEYNENINEQKDKSLLNRKRKRNPNSNTSEDNKYESGHGSGNQNKKV